MTLLQNEERIVTSKDDQIILTNQRIQMEYKDWGSSYIISIFLENISSIEKTYRSYYMLLILGILALLLSGYVSYKDDYNINTDSALWLLLAGGVLIILWLFSRRHVIKISSNGGSHILFTIKSMRDQGAEDFIDKLSYQKGERMIQLYKLNIGKVTS